MRKKYFLLMVLFVNICCMIVYGDSAKIKNPANGHWYQRFDTPMSWYQAKEYCESLGGHLATITSAEENNFVYLNVVYNPLSQVLECWLGATDEESDGIWKWVTGETWSYTNWGYGEPNNWGGSEDYLTMFTSVEAERFSKWNDRANNYNYSTICEWEAEKQTITVTSPNGGERWAVNDKHTIKWTTEGTVRNVKIEYSTDNGATWTTITSYTPNKGSYAWAVPNTPSSRCKIRVSEYHHGVPADTSDAVFSITATSTISLSRSKLNFCSLTSGTATAPQEVSITNNGSGTLKWNISVDAPWLICSPGSGIGSGAVLISVNSTGLTLGTYTGKVMISDPNATNSPQAVFVTLKVKSGAQYTGTFGEFSTPVDGSIVRSNIPVTGWALDDVEIQSVKIYREDGDALVLIGDVVFVEGARPDVEAAYPDYPFNYKAGWGYMLLTNFLPNGDGVFKLHAVAAGAEGKTTDLGIKTITVDNAHAVKPFGAIDTPTQGGTASGKSYLNSGWILTPMPNMIPTDGSTIGVWIDGVYIGRPVYNKYREDIALLFPGYANSNGAACYYYLDTTAYKNTVHTIQWTATDSGGNIDGIGSRYFSIQNSAIPGVGGANDQVLGIKYPGSKFRRGAPVCAPIFDPCTPVFDSYVPVNDSFGAVGIINGYREDAAATPQTVYPNEDGIIAVEIKELERVEIHFPVSPVNNISPLPIGSTLDVEKGIFYWQPGPGFIGEYHLVFMEKEETGSLNRKDVIINIVPGY